MPIRKAPRMQHGGQRRASKDKELPKVPVTLRLPDAHPRQYELINAFELHAADGVRFVVGACGTKAWPPGLEHNHNGVAL